MSHPSDTPHSSHVESRSRKALRSYIIQASTLLEIVLSGLVLIGLLLSFIPLLKWMPGLLFDGNDVEIRGFLERALDIVIGVEFIKMLAKHSPGSSLEVLLYAIARHMVVGHESALDNLISVGAIALIFVVRKFFFVPAFGAHLPDGKPAPDLTPNQSGIPAEEFRTRLRQRIHAEALADEDDDEDDETEEVESPRYSKTRTAIGRPRFFASIVVMSLALVHFDQIIFNAIDQPVHIIDPAAPIPAEIFFQPFRFSNAFIRAARNILEQCVDPFQRLFILRLPIQIFRKGLLREGDLTHVP